jgi:hypothetical protein
MSATETFDAGMIGRLDSAAESELNLTRFDPSVQHLAAEIYAAVRLDWLRRLSLWL